MGRRGPKSAQMPYAPIKRYRFAVAVTASPILHTFLELEGVDKMLEVFVQHLLDSDTPYARKDELAQLMYKAMTDGTKKAPKKARPKNTPRSAPPARPIRTQESRPAYQRPSRPAAPPVTQEDFEPDYTPSPQTRPIENKPRQKSREEIEAEEAIKSMYASQKTPSKDEPKKASAKSSWSFQGDEV